MGNRGQSGKAQDSNHDWGTSGAGWDCGRLTGKPEVGFPRQLPIPHDSSGDGRKVVYPESTASAKACRRPTPPSPSLFF